MNSKWMGSLALAVLLVGGAAVLAGGGTWVSKDGKDHHLHGHGDMTFISEFGDANELDVSELTDGETRILGEGEKQVSISRSGDEVTIRRTQPVEDADVINIVCRIASDSCRVLTFDDDPERVLIVVQKTRECINGVGDCDNIEIGAFGSGDGQKRILIRKTIDCDGEGEGECRDFSVIRHGAHHGANIVVDTLGDGDATLEEIMVLSADGAGNVMFFGKDNVTLRCPEGDTTMHVEKDEADDVFLCPRHSQPLEKVEMHRVLHHIGGPHADHD